MRIGEFADAHLISCHMSDRVFADTVDAELSRIAVYVPDGTDKARLPVDAIRDERE